MRLDQEIGRWYEVADDPGRSWEEKLAAYRGLVDDYYEVDRFREFCAQHLANADECMATYIDSPQFDVHLVETIRRAFPPHEHERLSPTTGGCSAPGSTTGGRPEGPGRGLGRGGCRRPRGDR
jgi:hypothetical protein